MKSLIKIIMLAVITVIAITILAKVNFNSVIKKPNSESSEKVTLQIEPGESVDSIINKLVDAGILKENWKNHFKYYLK
jgi:cell division protein YceG involved in septum cleavage